MAGSALSTSAHLAQRLHAGERLGGTILTTPDAALAELAASAFDFLWIDLEHSALTVRDVQTMAVCVRAGGCPTLVRVARLDSELVTAILDTGVAGLVIPHVETAAQAREAVAMLRYPPHGSRGFAHRRATAFGSTRGGATTTDGRLVCMVQIESAAGVQAAEEIASEDGVDVLVVGSADLALDLGIEADLEAPKLREAIDRVNRAAAATGVASGLAAGADPSVSVAALGEHSTVLVHSADVRLYAQALDQAATAVAAAFAAADRAAMRPTTV